MSLESIKKVLHNAQSTYCTYISCIKATCIDLAFFNFDLSDFGLTFWAGGVTHEIIGDIVRKEIEDRLSHDMVSYH